MELKRRERPVMLQLFSALRPRMILGEKDESYFHSLEKGYEGEKAFDLEMKSYFEKAVFLQDVTLEQNKSNFQLDSVAILERKLILFEIKYFFGDYFVKGEEWFSSQETEIHNPLNQLYKSTMLLKKWLYQQNIPYEVQSFVIFINPNFMLYQAPRHSSIIFHHQLPKLQKNLFGSSRVSNEDVEVGNMILANHRDHIYMEKVPQFSYTTLKKGLFCPKCHGEYRNGEKFLRCGRCQFTERKGEAIQRAIQEFKLLFVGDKLTTAQIMNWCGVENPKLIRKVLKEQCKYYKHNNHSYFL